MKKLAIFLLFISLQIKISGVASYSDYKFLIDGISKIAGVNSLLETNETQGEINLSGRLEGDPDQFINDTKSFVIDRFKVEEKRSGENLKIHFIKL